jgi:methylated-DNA-[protein]-cysteine S-methyltransferase
MSAEQEMRDSVHRALADGLDDARTIALQAELARRAAAAGMLEAGYDRLDSPLGRLLIAATPVGVVRVGFESESEERFLDEIARRVSARVLRAPRLVDDARRQLAEYFDGRRREFELELDWRLAAGFRRRVLSATAQIPFGQTRSYRDVATSAGSPRAVRAAGSALANNPLPIVVPCHRVLRSDGSLGGFRGGIAAKRALLGYEQALLPGA